MNETTAVEYQIGQGVLLNHIEGFGGKAIIVGKRDDDFAPWLVRLLDGTQPDLWANAGEIEPAELTRDDVIRMTADHIKRVGLYMADVCGQIAKRAVVHDQSKWSESEWPYFAGATAQLAGVTYGSDRYKEMLQEIKPAITHHNQVNTHHPEHFREQGIDGMTLLDLVEMMCDWKAASERHADGSVENSLNVNRERFKISPQLESILRNTCRAMGWLT